MIDQSARDRILFGLKRPLTTKSIRTATDEVWTRAALIAYRTRDELRTSELSAYDTADLIANLITELERAVR